MNIGPDAAGRLPRYQTIHRMPDLAGTRQHRPCMTRRQFAAPPPELRSSAALGAGFSNRRGQRMVVRPFLSLVVRHLSNGPYHVFGPLSSGTHRCGAEHDHEPRRLCGLPTSAGW